MKKKKLPPKKALSSNYFFILATAIIFAVAVFLPTKKLVNIVEPKESFTEDDLKNAGKIKGAKDLKTGGSLSPINPTIKNGLQNNFPLISATSAIAVDLNSGTILYEKDANTPLPPASTTKIATALVVLENYDLSKLVTIPKSCVGLEGNNVGFLENDKVSVENLLYGMLVKSSSDASCALASIDSKENFIFLMNNMALNLGLKNTNFTNEIGFDSENESHVSSANDLYLLAKKAMQNDFFRIIVGTRTFTIPSFINPQNPYFITTTNELLTTLPGTTGIKTGNTEKAKGCLVFSYDNLGKKILIVVMGSNKRFEDTKEILRWTLESFEFPH